MVFSENSSFFNAFGLLTYLILSIIFIKTDLKIDKDYLQSKTLQSELKIGKHWKDINL